MSTTKTSQMLALWNSGEFQKAIAIASTFKLGLDKIQKERLKICHEMQTGSSALYEQMGYKLSTIEQEAKEIIETVYRDKLKSSTDGV